MGRVIVRRGFAYLTKGELQLSGRLRRGGIALARDGKAYAELRMPASQFRILAVLIDRARHDLSHRNGSKVHGFMTAEDICAQIKSLAGITVSADRVVHTVCRLRDTLAELRGGTKAARDWAMNFLEFREPLGYRLSTDPKNLHLDLIPDPSFPQVHGQRRSTGCAHRIVPYGRPA